MSEDKCGGWTERFPGECCCKCMFHVEVMKHPFNQGAAKGSIGARMGWACTVKFGDGSNAGQIVFFDQRHGGCELFSKKP